MRRGVAITLGALLAVAVAASPALAAAPDAPAAPRVIAGDGQITVSFTPPADNGSTDHRIHGDLYRRRRAGVASGRARRSP